MEYIHHIESPLGGITLSSDGTALTGLWIDGQKYEQATLTETEEKKLPIFQRTEEWLEIYFNGKEPDFMPALAPKGTKFRQEVWKICRKFHMERLLLTGKLQLK